INQRQIAEWQLLTRGRPLGIDRAFDFEPAENHAGLAILFREWILPAGRARPGTEQPSRVRPDHLAGQKPGIQFMHARLRRHVEVTKMSEQTRWCFGGDRDRLVTVAFGKVVEIRNEPLVALARSDPYGIRVEAQLV